LYRKEKEKLKEKKKKKKKKKKKGLIYTKKKSYEKRTRKSG